MKRYTAFCQAARHSDNSDEELLTTDGTQSSIESQVPSGRYSGRPHKFLRFSKVWALGLFVACGLVVSGVIAGHRAVFNTQVTPEDATNSIGHHAGTLVGAVTEDPDSNKASEEDPSLMEPVLLHDVAMIAIIPTASMLFGSLTVLVVELSSTFLHSMQHLAAGVLLSAISTELLPHMVHAAVNWQSRMAIAMGFISGVIVMLVVETLGEDENAEEEVTEDANYYYEAKYMDAGTQNRLNSMRKGRSFLSKKALCNSSDDIRSLGIMSRERSRTLSHQDQLDKESIPDNISNVTSRPHRRQQSVGSQKLSIPYGAATRRLEVHKPSPGTNNEGDESSALLDMKKVIKKAGYGSTGIQSLSKTNDRATQADSAIPHIGGGEAMGELATSASAIPQKTEPEKITLNARDSDEEDMNRILHPEYDLRSNQSDVTKIPIARVVAIEIDSLLDGFLLGLSAGAGNETTTTVMAIAISIEMCFVGVAYGSSFRGVSCQKSVSLLVAAPLTLYGGTILGFITSSIVVSSPLLYTALISFGSSALLYLVCEDLLIEAHNAGELRVKEVLKDFRRGEPIDKCIEKIAAAVTVEERWFEDIWFFVGFLISLLAG